MKLNLGFESIPYTARYSPRSPLSTWAKKRRPRQLSQQQRAYGQGKTTRQVALELEEKYKIVETFYRLEEDKISELVEEAYGENIEKVMMMKGISKKGISEEATDKIERLFRRNLSSRKYDGVILGVPTQASLRGVSHLRQNPSGALAKVISSFFGRTSRPSFIDTGLYQRSFKAWMEP